MARVGHWLASILVAAAVVGSLAGAPPAAAQAAADETYLQYQRAIRAGERCRRDQPFGTPEHRPMSDYIDGKIGFALSAGRRLQLIEEAKREVDRIVDRQGCAAEDLAESLALYDSELAPLLPQ